MVKAKSPQLVKPFKLTIFQLLGKAQKLLIYHNVDNPRLEAELLLAHALGCQRSDLILRSRQAVPKEQACHFWQSVKRRLSYEPIAYITGLKEFWSLDFQVTKDTLIPRPETELIIEKVVDYVQKNKLVNLKILDLGTGSGNIAVTLAHELPTAIVFATDISKKAINIACHNAQRHGVSERCHFFLSNWFDAIAHCEQFHLIVSNPPYISVEEKDLMAFETLNYEPASALFSGQKGLFDILRLVDRLPRFLAPEGLFLCEIGFSQAELLKNLLKSSFFDRIWFERDMAGVERVLCIKNK